MAEKPEDAKTLIALCLSTLYILISAALINFNKYLMHKTRFPFATQLTTLHMSVSLACGLMLYSLKPDFFPSMERAKANREKILQYFAPLALLFAVGVVASNQAYAYAGVAFLQFMKQGNVAIVFGLSVLMGSQVLDRQRMLGVAWIICGCWLAVTGEVHFVFVGFCIQALSQISECCKNVLQEWILSGSDIKLDPLTYNLFIAPVCLCVLSVGNLFTWDSRVIPQFFSLWYLLIPNALCAFSLNVTIAIFIKNTSAMCFILAGVVKDMVIVIFSSYFFNESLALQQIFGFSLATSGIFFWSLLNKAPDHWFVRAVSSLVGVGPMRKEEDASQPLMMKKV